MSGIAKAREKMKKKISFDDYGVESQKTVEKTRKVYCLPKEGTVMLKEIFTKRAESNHAISMQDLISEAIQLLYKQEIV